MPNNPFSSLPPILQGISTPYDPNASFGQNALSFLGNIPASAINMGKQIISGIPQQVSQAEKDVQQYGPVAAAPITAGRMALGMASNINRDIGSPVQVQNGAVSVKSPDFGAAGQNLFQNPVGVAADVAMVKGAVKGFSGEPAIPKTAAEETITAPFSPKTTPVSPEGTPVRNMPTPNVSDAAANIYMKPYTIPTGLGVDAVKTAKWMINDSADVSKVGQFLQTIENIKKQALQDATAQKEVVPTGSAIDVANKSLTSIPELASTPKALAKYKQELISEMPQSVRAVGQVTGKTNLINTDPLSAFQSIKNLESKGYEYLDNSTDAYGKVTNKLYQRLGSTYINTARQLESNLDDTMSAAGAGNDAIIRTYTQSPAIQQAISQYSPTAAQRLANNVLNWSDLRSIEAPAVNMSKIIDWTRKSANTPGANFGGRIGQGVAGGIGYAAGNAVGGPAVGIPMAAAAGLAEPIVSAAGMRVLPPIASGVAGAVNAASKLPIAPLDTLKAIGTVGYLGKGLSPQENAGQPPADNKGNNYTQGSPSDNIIPPAASGPVTYDKLPQNTNQVSPDQNGNYSAPNPSQILGKDGKPIVLSQGDYQTQRAALNSDYQQKQALANTLNTPKNIEDAATAKATLDNFDAKQTQGSKLQDYYNTVTSQTDQAAAEVRRILQTTDPSIFSLNKTFDQLRSTTDPRYKELINALQALDNVNPNLHMADMVLKSGGYDSALAALNEINKSADSAYYTMVRNYLGYSPGQSVTPTTTQPPAGLPAPTGGGLPPLASQTISTPPSSAPIPTFGGQ